MLSDIAMKDGTTPSDLLRPLVDVDNGQVIPWEVYAAFLRFLGEIAPYCQTPHFPDVPLLRADKAQVGISGIE